MKKAEVGIETRGLSYIGDESSVTEYIKGIEYALTNGVRLIDTSNSLDDTKQLIGDIIKPIRSSVKVVSNFTSNDVNGGRFKEEVLHTCENTLKKLSTDYIDFYQLDFDDPRYDVDEVIDAMEQLKVSGKIIRYGIGQTSEERMKTYIEKGDVSSLMLTYSAMERKSAHKVLNLCKANHIETMVCNVTGQPLDSRLQESQKQSLEVKDNNREKMMIKERLMASKRILNFFGAIGKQKGWTKEQIAIAWVLHDQRVNYALISPAAIHHMAEKLKSRDIKLNEKELQYIHQVITEEEIRLERIEGDIM